MYKTYLSNGQVFDITNRVGYVNNQEARRNNNITITKDYIASFKISGFQFYCRKLNNIDKRASCKAHGAFLCSFLRKEERIVDFGAALKALKEGKKVARAGWNGKGMYVYLVHGFDCDKENLRNEASQILPHRCHALLPHRVARSVMPAF